MPKRIGAAQPWLPPGEREAVFSGCAILIDSLFEEYGRVVGKHPQSIFATRLGKWLPRSYSSYYTPFFFKQFGICVVSMAWKIAQSSPLPPSSIAEQLAGWAIVQEANEMLKQESNAKMTMDTRALQERFKRLFPDTSFLCLFDRDGEEVQEFQSLVPQVPSIALDEWFLPFPGRMQRVHPYAGGRTHVGRAYTQCLTKRERSVLAGAIEVLIDELFNDLVLQKENWSKNFAHSTLSWHLPSHYSSHYTPLFLKQFIVCILTVAWKLAQPKQMLLSSVAEELASWAIITAAKGQIELEYDIEGKMGGDQEAENAFENFIEEWFEDEDFMFLFQKQYGGIHAEPIGQLLGMTSLAFTDWMKPFSDDSDRLAHPYVWRD